VGIALLASIPGAASADTTEIFSRFADPLVKIRVVERGSGAKAVIGSGFRVTSDGLIDTNYHVISKLVSHPDRYRAEQESESGHSPELEVLGVFQLKKQAFNTGFSNALEFPGEIAPISTGWLRPVGADAYFEQVAALRETVDALAAERDGSR
jgi:hypothetical protein